MVVLTLLIAGLALGDSMRICRVGVCSGQLSLSVAVRV